MPTRESNIFTHTTFILNYPTDLPISQFPTHLPAILENPLQITDTPKPSRTPNPIIPIENRKEKQKNSTISSIQACNDDSPFMRSRHFSDTKTTTPNFLKIHSPFAYTTSKTSTAHKIRILCGECNNALHDTQNIKNSYLQPQR